MIWTVFPCIAVSQKNEVDLLRQMDGAKGLFLRSDENEGMVIPAGRDHCCNT